MSTTIRWTPCAAALLCALLVAGNRDGGSSAPRNPSARQTSWQAAPLDAPAVVDATAERTQRQRAWAIPYNGRFTFTRLMYGGGGFGRRGGGSWSHDYPNADLNIPEILEFMTSINVTTGASNVFTLDDPRLFQYPMLYVSEPGFWTITDSEAANLRDYVLKGGFLVFDDFEGNQLRNMVAQVERALPGFELIEIGPDHEIFDSFFLIENIYIPHPLVAVTPVYYGIFEDNDPSKRMLAIVNHNNDLAEYWEFAHTGYFPVDITNEAYKLGVNYIVYAMTH
jgi:hypothetical protein